MFRTVLQQRNGEVRRGKENVRQNRKVRLTGVGSSFQRVLAVNTNTGMTRFIHSVSWADRPQSYCQTSHKKSCRQSTLADSVNFPGSESLWGNENRTAKIHTEGQEYQSMKGEKWLIRYYGWTCRKGRMKDGASISLWYRLNVVYSTILAETELCKLRRKITALK